MHFLKNMLSSGSKVSSKRVVTFICLLFMLIGYVANLFWNFEVADNMFESLQWIVMAGLDLQLLKILVRHHQNQ